MSESNPLLDGLRLPGRIFQLPSRGIFYHNGELASDVRDGEVHVFALSALDEINLKNPDQLFSGAAVNTIFSTCVKGINKPSELLSKDVDAVMLFLRAVTYGSSYEFVASHGCADAKDHTYVADVDVIISGMKMIDPTIVDRLYTVTLPTGQVIKLRPNRYQQVLDLIKSNESKKEITVEDQQENLVAMLLGVIEQVDAVRNPAHIAEWVRKIPTTVVNRIAEKIENVNDWGSDLKWTCKCKDCGVDFKVEIPINPVIFFAE